MQQIERLVVIGAGLGGFEALLRVVAAIPAIFPAAVVVLVHDLPFGAKPAMQMLSERALLPVAYAKPEGELDTGAIRVAPAGCHLSIVAPGVISLDGGPKIVRTGRPAIDLFFESAAVAFKHRVVGLVLSGADGDGTDGLRAIKAAGGVSVVQSPADSKVPSMPSSAIMGDHPDHCVLLDEIGPLLVRLIQQTTSPESAS